MRRFLALAVTAAGFLVIGIFIGRLGGPEPRVETRTRTVDVERTVEVTPAICLEALDLAGEGFQYSYEAAQASADALDAVSTFDVAGIDAATRRINAVTEKVEALTPQMVTAVEGCREKA